MSASEPVLLATGHSPNVVIAPHQTQESDLTGVIAPVPVHVCKKVARRGKKTLLTEPRIGIPDAGAHVDGEIPVYRTHDTGEKLTIGESLGYRHIGANIAMVEIFEELRLELRPVFLSIASIQRKQVLNLPVLTRAHMQRKAGYREPHVVRSKQQGIGG